MRDWVCWLVRGLAKLGAYPVGAGCDEKEIYWVPVDQVAKAVVLLSLDHEHEGGVEQVLQSHSQAVKLLNLFLPSLKYGFCW